MKRFVVGGALIATVTITSWLAYRAGKQHATAGSAPNGLASASPVAAAAPRTMRTQVRDAIEKTDVRGRAGLDQFLDTLEARARARGKVTALEIEPGLEMIQRYSSDAEDIERFSERMRRLQEELSGARAKQENTTPQGLAGLLERAALSTNDTEKQALVRDYLDAVNRLPEEQQGALLEQLNTRLGQKAALPDDATLDAAYAAIELARDDATRQGLIRDYLELLSELPERDRDSRLAGLNAKFSAEVPRPAVVNAGTAP